MLRAVHVPALSEGGSRPSLKFITPLLRLPISRRVVTLRALSGPTTPLSTRGTLARFTRAPKYYDYGNFGHIGE